MRVLFTFKHMDSSKSLMDVTESKFSNLLKRFKPGPRDVRVTFDTDGALKRMHVSLVTGDGRHLEATQKGENAYSLIDAVVQKMDGQLRRQKERRKLHKGAGIRTIMKSRADIYSLGDRFERVANDESWKSMSFWNEPAIDAVDILSLSPHARGPLEPICAS